MPKNKKSSPWIILIIITIFIIAGFVNKNKQTDNNSEFSSQNNCVQIDKDSEQTANFDKKTKRIESNSEFSSSNDHIQIDKNPKQTSSSDNVNSNKPKRSTKKSTKNSTLNYKIVYITKTGEKYHYANPCGRGSYFAVSLENAINMGYKPCGKCAKY